MRPAYIASLVALSSLFGLAACGGGSGVSGPTGVICTPACPSGFTCTVNGCTANNAALDLAVPVIDMAADCPSPCGGGTVCNKATHQCVPCLVDTDCPAGQICAPTGQTFVCLPGCKDDSRCAQLKTDGGAGGRCCNGQCSDPSSDPNNCGACGMACVTANGNAACLGGTCTAGACRAGWGDCNGNPLDGCETNLRSDPNNCKGCGMGCKFANGIGGCSDGCYLAGCDFGFDDCNMDPSDGCETSTLSDKKNCGSCGSACGAKPHASVDCINANCQLTKCDVGWSDCDGNPANGCEVNTGVDINNCGRCGNVCGNGQVCRNSGCTCMACNIPNATTKCVNLVCVFDKCLPNYADCNFNLADGCETEIDNDPKNCGACGNVCNKPTPSCSGGACVAGFDFGPDHSFTGLTGHHFITQGCCSVGCANNLDSMAQYFCDHFYGAPMGLTCTPVKGYVQKTLVNCSDVKLHKNGGCTGNGNNINGTTCDTGPCKIGNWNECTTGIENLVCHCM